MSNNPSFETQAREILHKLDHDVATALLPQSKPAINAAFGEAITALVTLHTAELERAEAAAERIVHETANSCHLPERNSFDRTYNDALTNVEVSIIGALRSNQPLASLQPKEKQDEN